MFELPTSNTSTIVVARNESTTVPPQILHPQCTSTMSRPEEPMDTAIKSSQRPRRVCALFVGLLVICSVAGATFFFLQRSGVQLLRARSTSNITGGIPTNSTELQLHNTPDDCWMAIHAIVYDLTSYGPRHPAGSQWIWDRCGMEATADYDRYHSSTRFLQVADQVGPYGDSTTAVTPQGGGGFARDSDDDDDD